MNAIQKKSWTKAFAWNYNFHICKKQKKKLKNVIYIVGKDLHCKENLQKQLITLM